MPWLPLYLDAVDAARILQRLNDDPDLAFLVGRAKNRWVAQKTMESVSEGRHCLWHQPSGPLPLLRDPSLPAGTIDDPWAGWQGLSDAAHPELPFFGAGHPGIIWWNVRTRSREWHGGIGMSSFEWIGNRYAVLGSQASPAMEAWWRRLRGYVKSCQARRVPRSGALDGPGAEIWAMPSALAALASGTQRDANAG